MPQRLVQNIAIADARRNNVLVLIQQSHATLRGFRVGELTITHVSQAEVRLEGARADLVQAEAQIRIAEAAFQRAIGQKPGRLGEGPRIATLPISETRRSRWRWISVRAPSAPSIEFLCRQLRREQRHRQPAAPGQSRRRHPAAVGPAGPDRPVLHLRCARAGDDTDLPERQRVVEVRQAKELVGQRRNELDSARRAQAENVIRLAQLDASRLQVTSFEAQVRANEVALNGVRQEALVGSHHPRRVERRAGIA